MLLEFDDDELLRAAVAFEQTNDAINGSVDLPGEVQSQAFADNDEARLWLAELLYDAWKQNRLILNAWSDWDTDPCAEAGEHFYTQRHPFEECPTYPEGEG